MLQVPYNIIADEANHLIDMAASSNIESQYYWDMYYALLHGCGWTDKEFDEETLYRIDNYWEQVSIGKVVPIRFKKNNVYK
jgi:hypothetical protein